MEILRQLDDDSLQKVNLVPVRPSVLTLLRKMKCHYMSLIILSFTVSNYVHYITAGLRKLKFGFSSHNNVEVQVHNDQVFQSKLTGILAFKKMAKKGVEIKCVYNDAQAALCK